MKKILFLTLTLTLGISSFGHLEAKAKTGAPLWVCHLGFKGRASGFKVLVGRYHFHGTGRLSCVNVIGQTVSYPVALDMRAKPVSLGVALGRYTVYGTTPEISLFNCDPDELLGKYMIAQGHATIVGGVGGFTAVRVGNPQLALAISLHFSKGIGMDLSLNQLRISPLNGSHSADPVVPPEDDSHEDATTEPGDETVVPR